MKILYIEKKNKKEKCIEQQLLADKALTEDSISIFQLNKETENWIKSTKKSKKKESSIYPFSNKW